MRVLNGKLTRALEERDRIMTEMMENDSPKGCLKIYENPRAPPSHGSVPAQQRKARSAKGAGPSGNRDATGGGRSGRRPGHAGISHHRRSMETIHHRPGRCGGTGLPDTRTTAKQVADIERMPKAVTVCHGCVCPDCDAVTAPKPPGIRGTSPGPGPLAFLTSVWGRAVGAGNATMLLNGTFGTRLCKTAVKHAPVAAAGRLQKTADEMNAPISESRYLRMDETPIGFNGRRQYAWARVGNTVVVIRAGTRGAAEIDCHFPYCDRPITCDGYAAYNAFHLGQRCWTHIPREAEFVRHAGDNPTAVMLLCREAKLEPPDAGNARLGEPACRSQSMAGAYAGLDDGFAVRLENAAPDLLTLMLSH